MKIIIKYFGLPLLLLLAMNSYGQQKNYLKGKIYDVNDGLPMEGVVVHNIFTDEIVYTDSLGKYSIAIQQGELVEFKKFNYKMVRKRIHSNRNVYFDIPMVYGVIELEEFIVYGKSQQRLIDSIKTAEVFQKALQMKDVNPMQSPITALSKEYRRIKEFQNRYQQTEKEKYIEFIFSEDLIHSLTQLGKDSIADYRRRFRPQIDDLSNWSEYEFYSYIKRTVEIYRTNRRYYSQD